MHKYLSTGCFHDDHKYCQAMTGLHGEKRPGRCKFCDAQCVCSCHDLPNEWLKTVTDLGGALVALSKAWRKVVKP